MDAPRPLFRLLGEFEVWSDQAPVRVGGRLRRSLLAFLLVHARRSVPLDVVCDRLWGGDPPPSARATVRTYVSQFRKLGVPGFSIHVGTDGQAYRAQVDRSQVDAHCFEDLLTEATSEAEPARRLALLDAALSLWRDEALSEFLGAAWADEESRRLAAVRRRAVTDRFRLLVDLRRAGPHIPELEAAVVAEPLDEQLAMLLARARYQAGRPAEALEALAAARRRIAEEIGLDVSPSLTDLEMRILRRDPSLTAGAVGSAPSLAPASTLPSGTVAFLFTDIQGSTRLLEALGPERYAEALGRHREIIADAVTGHGGQVFGTEGDAVFAVFERAGGAIDAAVQLQLALAAEPWPGDHPVVVRAGLHAGEVLRVDDSYVGTTLHVVARVAAAAHGGQVVATEACLALTPSVPTMDLGWHRLKDVDRPIRLAQVLVPGSDLTFPPLRTTANVPTNLPAAIDEFVGRADERSILEGGLHEHRLVTLVGPGGVGKTRLAVETSHRLLQSFPGGVWLVELAPIAPGGPVLAAVAATIGIQERGDVTLMGAVGQSLGSSATLLVLDNCEHVLDPAAELAAALLARCPGLHILVTSRERLGVRGEWLFDLAPLPTTPGPDSRSDAELLFELRARAVHPSFDVRSDPDAVRRVCQHLDGLPLAIELAASRLRGLSLRDVDARLGDRFALLRSGHRHDAGRHQTLEAVVEWSHEALPVAERAVFNRLSVFGDSFSLSAAEHVVSGDPVRTSEVADCLLRLVDKSLVVRVADTPSTRYRLLETLRQFGRARLSEAGALMGFENRLLDWALDVVAGLERDMRTTRQDAALREVVPDHGNLRAALDVALARNDEFAALRIVTAVPLATPGQRADMIDRILSSAADLPPVAVGRALLAVSNLSFTRATQERGIAAAREAADIFAVEGDARLVSWSRFFELFCLWGLDDLDHALEAARAAESGFRSTGDEFGSAYTLWALAMLTTDPVEGEAMAREAAELHRKLGTSFALAHVLEGLALRLLELDRSDEARAPLTEALTSFADADDAGCTAHCLDAVAAVAAHAGHLAVTAELMGAADRLREVSGQEPRPWERRSNAAAAQALAESPDQALVAAERERGRRHDLASASSLGHRVLSVVSASTRRRTGVELDVHSELINRKATTP